MATTSNTYTGNGSNKLFSITFPYLETTDVDVYLNGTLQTITTQYTFANATTIEFVSAPANGAVILLDRSTDDATLQATFFPGSSIKAADLNLDFDQVLYIAQETSNEATTATTTAATATTTANTALSQSAAAVSTANTASSNASAAVSTANTASTNASNAVTTANTASSNATTAVNTANAATSTANTASSNASAAVSTANTASSNASAAVSTANTASSNASAAVSTANAANSTANTASGNASTAVTTANNAVTTANTANSNSNTAVTTANAAAAAVANAVLYTTVANVAAIPGSPANNAAVEVTNSTGIESFTPLSGLPAGFIGSSGLSVRIIYQTSGATWTWIQYFPNDPETRYLKLAGGTLTGSITVPQGTVASPGIKFSGTGNDNTGVYSSGIDELGLVTNGVNRLSIDSAGAISIPGTLGVTGAVTGTSTVSGSALIPTGSSVPSNGVYLPAANSVAISSSGSQRLVVDANGCIGIGMTPNNAAYRLQIYDAAQDAVFISIGNNVSGSGNLNGLVIGQNQNDAYFLNRENGPALFYTNNTERLRITAAGLVGIGVSSPSNLLHLKGGNPQLIVDTPDASTEPRIRLFKNNGTAVGQLEGISGNTRLLAEGAFQVMTNGGGGAGATAAYFDTSGRLGIGTTTVDGSLTIKNPVVSGENSILSIQSAATTGQIARLSFNQTDDIFRVFNNTSGGSLAFGTNNIEKARLDSSGRLLVGTSTSLSSYGINGLLNVASNGLLTRDASFSYFKNDIYGPILTLAKSRSDSIGTFTYPTSGDLLGTLAFSGAHTGNGRFDLGVRIDGYANQTWTSTAQGSYLTFSTTADGASSPTERMRISSTGGVRLPDVYNQTIALSANVFIDTDGTLKRATSSIKYKTNIETLEDQYADAVLNCRPVWYQSTSAGDNPNWGFWGFIAEEVAEIDPRLVQWKTVEQVVNEDGSRETVPLDAPEPENVAYDRFVPHLLNLIKRQGEAIVDLQAEVAALKAQ